MAQLAIDYARRNSIAFVRPGDGVTSRPAPIMRTLGKIAVTLGVIGGQRGPPLQRGTAIIIATTAIIIEPSSILCLLSSLRSTALLRLRWGRWLTQEMEL
jgi:hypothetical protein